MPYKSALKALKQLEAEFDKSHVGLRGITPIAFNEFPSIYIEYSRANKAYNSWRRYTISLKALNEYFGTVLINSIGIREIELYKAKRQQDGLSLEP